MTNQTTAKRDVQKLQRAIVDGLENVKAQDIRVFNTEHLSPLFERVIVASGTSNRQAKALAFGVMDAVRDAGFPKPRMEGQENGEWIIVDCGAAVAHIMQPAIRQYYQLEEIWGDKPVRLKLGAPLPVVVARSTSASAGPASEKARAAPKRGAPRSLPRSVVPARRAAAKKPASANTPERRAPAKKPAARKQIARRT